tara:strand:+ start:1034 stop:1312 length:279 start_codon:yes stop_codon:yes gene_type:complete
MSSELFIYIIILCLVATACLTWLLFVINYILGKYTSFGRRRSKENRKKKKIQNSQDDVPIKGTNLNPFSTPKIETSFGDKRIGKVYKNDNTK